jgi:hypothetical protein
MASTQPAAKPDVMAEDSGDAPDAQAADQAQTVELPVAAFGQAMPNPGDTVSLKVVSVDAQNGVVNATVMPPQAGPQMGGSDAMAAEFNNKPA